MGVVGLSFGDFCRLTYPEMEAVMKAHRETSEQMQRSEWEQMRLHAVMTMQPHCRKRLDPKKVLPFDWDEDHRRQTTPVLSKEEAKQAFLQRVRRDRH